MHIRRQGLVNLTIFQVIDCALFSLAVLIMLAWALELPSVEIVLFAVAGFVAAWTIAEQVIFWEQPDDPLGSPHRVDHDDQQML